MNIGFDASRAFINNRTGTENYSFQILKSLSQIDHTNNYQIYLRPQVKVQKSNWPGNFHFVTVNFPRLWTQIGLAKQTFIDYFLDVLFIPSHTLPIIHLPGLKTVMTVHDLGSQYLPQTHQLKQKLYLNFITSYQLKTASHLIAVSASTKQDLITQADISANKISVIYEGYNQQTFKPVKTNALSSTLDKYNLKPGEYFLFVGTIQPRKNLVRLIKAYARFLREGSSPLCLVLVGSKGWLSDDIYQLAKKLGLGNRVRFLGYVKDQDLPAFYSGALALLFPSLFEGFGLPVLEAQACGCPVLTSNLSSLPEVAGKGATYVNPYSVEDIARGMARLMIDNLRLKTKKLGFENIKRFSWEKAARETLKVISN